MEIKTKFNIGDEVYFKNDILDDKCYVKGVEDEIHRYTVGWMSQGKIFGIYIKDTELRYGINSASYYVPESDIISDKKQAAFDDIADRIGELWKSIKVLEEVRARIEKMEDF